MNKRKENIDNDFINVSTMNASNGFDSLKMFFHEESVMDNDVKLDQDYHFNEINLKNWFFKVELATNL